MIARASSSAFSAPPRDPSTLNREPPTVNLRARDISLMVKADDIVHGSAWGAPTYEEWCSRVVAHDRRKGLPAYIRRNGGNRICVAVGTQDDVLKSEALEAELALYKERSLQ